ncbi:LCP family protein [Pseudonocardia hydrocarbonoxydans]|uniref:LytTR family transcriptional regulator n=1 Tax=Pseudonocardia hydrocarbonoxydans TaxID=76726 RepID=A0A4Y3WSW7_9PSEU|nr:LCP family protein [Pseudonocardia hydrocarbonoxydans]GEC21955.1 LytTR family transcriptional regulator [Pseudonocardia hydrocarbonoxydans]
MRTRSTRPVAGSPVPAPRPAPAVRRRPKPVRTPAPRPAPGRVLRRLRIATVVASALVLAVTGTAWGLYRDITAGIVTTDVISGGGDGGAQNILLVGVDSRTDAQGNPLPPEILRELNSGADTGVLNSDTIMMLHLPEDGGAAAAFSIPRDTYVDIPGYRTDKINAAYPAVKALTAERLVADGIRNPAQVEAEAARAGRSALIGAVERLTGQQIDHYAELNLVGFYDLTRAIGGVDVCLAAPVDEPLSGARFAAGPQTISGRDALAFVRQRHGLPDGDLSRIRRQQVFLAAVADKVLSAGTLTDPAALGALIGVIQQSVVLDEGWDLLAFAQQASDIAAGNLEFVTIPTEGAENNARGDVLLVDPDVVRGFVEERIEAQRLAAEAAAQVRAAEPPPPVTVIASRYIVHVLNGSEAGGLAGDVRGHLTGLGFSGGTVDNTEPAETSVVRHSGADGEAARSVADQLGGIDVERDESVPRGHLTVVLGGDFDPSVLPAPPPAVADDAAPPPPVDAAITAAGVPCID